MSENDKYLVKQQRKFEDQVEVYRSEASKSFRDLNRQILLFATAVLFFSLIALQNTRIIENFSYIEKLLLTFTWIFLAISIVAGVVQYITDVKFYEKWMNAKFSIVEKIANNNITQSNIRETVKKEQKDLPGKSNRHPIYIQMIFGGLSVTLLVILFIKLLFKI